MSALATHRARAGLRTLAAQSSRRTALSRVASSRAVRAYSSNKKDSLESSFQGQMLESISSRIAREKAEREKFAKQRQESAGARGWATTFVVLFASGFSYYLGTKSPRDLDPTSTLPLALTRELKHNNDKANLEAAWSDFAAIVGKENVSTVEADLHTHANSDWSSYRNEDSQKPFMVIYPGSTEDVSKIMKICHERRIPVVGYSGGTSLEGHFTPTRGGICVDFRRMDKIIHLHKDDMDVVVQPGTNAYRYGTMREWVLSLTVVLADGTVIKTRQRPRKSSAGYDLTKLFIGSEGTLGLVTEATLKLTTKPTNTSVAVCSFGTIRQAADCVSKVVGQGIPVAAVEILDDEQMKCINAAGMTSKTWTEAPTLFFKFSGTERGVKEQINIVKDLAKQAGSVGFDFAKSEQEQAELWSARKEALWSTMALAKPGDKVWTGDVAVPMSRLPQLIEETKDDMKKSGMYGTIVGHVGDGNFHIILLSNDEQRHDAEELVHRMVKRAVELEGTVTGEHGVGLVKRDYLPHELGETTVDLMRKIKQALDPQCLLNCDKVIRVQRPKPGEVAEW
ncbi:hypothetical protein EKO27_g1416 [Xylaria grammica]|uniref:D-lactate dehydrogenase (cytochrome) n=1 Tax=Xylaria grammica TaxID=363999 RepID=A0A439DH00_9PEZI|nr:hypothetical protein EKO27_g1416 [Xylaria grammica]